MEKELFDKAKRNINNADTVLNVIYPMNKDSKLLIRVLDKIYQALNYGLQSLLVCLER